MRILSLCCSGEERKKEFTVTGSGREFLTALKQPRFGDIRILTDLKFFAIFEVFTARTMKNGVFWDVTSFFTVTAAKNLKSYIVISFIS
jgi:hypothetical protein